PPFGGRAPRAVGATAAGARPREGAPTERAPGRRITLARPRAAEVLARRCRETALASLSHTFGSCEAGPGRGDLAPRCTPGEGLAPTPSASRRPRRPPRHGVRAARSSARATRA